MSTSEQQRSGEFTYSVGECPLQGQSLATHTWTPSTPAASWRGVVVIFHGYGAHGAYPTVKFGAELLASHGFVCMSVDFLGHGGSPGLPGYIAAAEDLTSCGTEFFEHAQATHPQMRCFLMGTSMGGAIALNVSLRVGIQCSGMVLLAPMCRIAPEAMPPAWQVPLLKAASYLCPRWAVIPSAAADDDAQYKDAERRTACSNCPGTYTGKMRLATGYALLQTTVVLQERLHEVNTPFFVLHGTADTIVAPDASEELHSRATTTDKAIKMYEGALHGLLCEELPLRATIEGDIVAWFTSRTGLDSDNTAPMTATVATARP